MGLLRTRLAGFLAGSATAGALYVSTKRLVWHKTAELAEAVPGAPPPPPERPAATAPALLGADVRAALARRWNAGVDAAFRPVIRFLADRDL